jgi:hypothetical protein
MIIRGAFVIKHCKFFHLNDTFILFSFKQNVMLIDLDPQEYLQCIHN